MSTWRKVRYLKNICVSDYHNIRHLFEAWWQIFLIPAYLTTTTNIFLRNKLEAQPAQNRLFGITQGETFGEISKLEQLFYFVSGAQWAPVYVRWSVLTTLARILYYLCRMQRRKMKTFLVCWQAKAGEGGMKCSPRFKVLIGKCVRWWEPAVTNQGNNTHLSKWNERFLKINHESGIFCCKGAYIGWSK